MYPSSNTGIVDRFTVAFTSLSLTSPSGTDTLTPEGFAQPAILDSGTFLTYLPDDLAMTIFNEIGAVYQSTAEVAICDCFVGTVNATLSFGFAGAKGVTIQVPISELVIPYILPDGSQATSDSVPLCTIGIGLASSLPEGLSLLIGDTMLRSAYVVYDLANFRIGLAQTKFNSTDSNIVAFSSLSADIPSATSVADEPVVTQTASKGIAGGSVQPTTAGLTAAPTDAGGEMFTGNAGPGFSTAATQTAAMQTDATQTGATVSSSTAKPTHNFGGRETPFSWLSVGLMGVLICVITQSFA
jgi:hypothetical protein